MDTPRRKVIVRARQGDVIIFSESPDGGEVFVRIKRAGANGKAGAAPKPWKWSDKLRAIYEAATDKPQSREEVMARAGYARDTHAHELFRRLVKAGWLLEAAGLVRKNPEPPGEPPG